MATIKFTPAKLKLKTKLRSLCVSYAMAQKTISSVYLEACQYYNGRSKNWLLNNYSYLQQDSLVKRFLRFY